MIDLCGYEDRWEAESNFYPNIVSVIRLLHILTYYSCISSIIQHSFILSRIQNTFHRFQRGREH